MNKEFALFIITVSLLESFFSSIFKKIWFFVLCVKTLSKFNTELESNLNLINLSLRDNKFKEKLTCSKSKLDKELPITNWLIVSPKLSSAVINYWLISVIKWMAYNCKYFNS